MSRARAFSIRCFSWEFCSFWLVMWMRIIRLLKPGSFPAPLCCFFLGWVSKPAAYRGLSSLQRPRLLLIVTAHAVSVQKLCLYLKHSKWEACVEQIDLFADGQTLTKHRAIYGSTFYLLLKGQKRPVFCLGHLASLLSDTPLKKALRTGATETCGIQINT